MLGLLQGGGFLLAQALELLGDAGLDLELDELLAGGVGLERSVNVSVMLLLTGTIALSS